MPVLMPEPVLFILLREHAFLIVKRDFGYKKVVYRGIHKNLKTLKTGQTVK